MDAKQVWEEVNSSLMPQYGTSMHWPYCRQYNCTGCIPDLARAFIQGAEEAQKLDLRIFRSECEGNWSV